MLLDLTIDDYLTFKDHIDTLCRNASYKVHALRRIRKYLTLNKAKVIYNAFTNSKNGKKKKKKKRGNKDVIAEVLNELSKAFDCIPYGLLMAKLNAFGLNEKLLFLYFDVSL